MEALKLNDQEQRLYQDLFHSCDVEGTGKVSGTSAIELLRTAGLSADTLYEIMELCGAKRLGMFGRSQFYVALKLVAVAQSKLPVTLESISSDVPLPEFKRNLDQGSLRVSEIEQEAAAGDIGKSGQQPMGQLPPPPTKKHARNLSGQYRGVPGHPPEGAPQYQPHPQVVNDSKGEAAHNSKSPVLPHETSPPTSPRIRVRDGVSQEDPSVITQPPSQPPPPGLRVQPVHPVGHIIPSQARNNLTLNSVHDSGGWAQFEDDEHHGLLGSGAKKSWEHLEGHTIDTSSISSENESIDDVWTISDEQREYYINQFKTMQPDLSGVIKGNIAKEFFEKSRLPVQELSKIWQLSDFNKDGALSLEEFCTAMHLVVLKRNDVELPDHLPPSLMPYSTLVNDEPFASDLPPGSTIKRASPLSPSASQWPSTFLSDSPSSSDISSPVIKPVNFEVNLVSQDPEANIVHPVALRMSPDGHSFPTVEAMVDRSRTTSDPVHYETNHDPPDMLIPSKPRSSTESSSAEPTSPILKLHGNLHGRPRPVPKKSASATLPGQLQPPPLQPSSQPAIVQPSSPDEPLTSPSVRSDLPTTVPAPSLLESTSSGVGASPAPPQLPPRPTMHNRSVSVDLKLKIDGGLMPPPAVPPRMSPKDGLKKPSEKFTFGPVDCDRPVKVEAAKLKRFEPIPSQEVLNILSTEKEPVETKSFSGQSTLERHRRAKSLDFHQTPVTPQMTEVPHTDHTDGPQLGAGLGDGTHSKVKTVLEEDPDLLQDDISQEREEISGPRDKPRQSSIALRQGSRDKRDIQLALRTHRERNSMLCRVNSELNQELQEVMEQRIALEIQLEHLRPFSS
ncbi:ralBP1-associated Eps domain-containing protein 1-like isoform X2 [Liolophura sinensis]|uniref:ralBP1-associated Eps domain-containing protein 1-like isoform X2 n=1 Tax=Liolophura sinensis TaxID=3198878 RepID=UPI003158D793